MASPPLNSNAAETSAVVVKANTALRVGTVTIASGQSLSGSIDLGAGQFVSVIKPNGWTAANLTFSGVDR